MMKRKIYLSLSLLLLSPLSILKGQNLIGYEYWFDDNYANKVYIENSSKDIALSLDMFLYPQGMHYFSFRVYDNKGKWSPILTQYFYRTQTDDTAMNGLDSYEYWIDDNYADKQIVANNDGIITFDLNADNLQQGMHCFNIRAKNKRGLYSTLTTQYFYRTQTDDTAMNRLDSYEYWIDNNYADKQIVANNDGIITFDLNADNLRQGMHYFNIRAKNKKGLYSTLTTQYFYKPRMASEANTICQYRYWFNNEWSSLKTVDIKPANPLDLQNVMIDVPNIIPDKIPNNIELTFESSQLKLHIPEKMEIHMQFKDSAEQWSSVQTDVFQHDCQTDIKASPITINTEISLEKPASNKLQAFSINITNEDSVCWKTDQPCRIAFYNPSGKQLCTLSPTECMNGKWIKIGLKGTYYALLHSVVKNETYNKDVISFICEANVKPTEKENILYKTNTITVYGLNGILYIESSHPQTIGIYRTDGRIERLIKVNKGKNEIHGLNEGIYLIEYHKIIIAK